MLKVERLDCYSYSVTGEGIDAKVKYYERWDHKVTGKGSRTNKEEIIAAVRSFISNEYKVKVEAAKKEVEEFRKTLKNIDDFSLYSVTVHEESHDHGLVKYNKLITGYELMDKYTPAIAAERVEIKNTDFYSLGNDSHYKRLALADDRLLVVGSGLSGTSVYVTGLTLKEKLLDGLKSYDRIREANQTEENMIMQYGTKNPTTFDILDFSDKSKEKEVSRKEVAERIKKEIERAKNNSEIVERLEVVGVTPEGEPIKRAWFVSKPCSIKEVIEKCYATYEEYVVKETYTLSKDAFELFELTLNMEEAGIKFEGGSSSTYESPVEYAEVESFYDLPEEEQSKWIMGSYNMAAEIKCNEKEYSILIDPQGYSYPRYVAILGDVKPEPEKYDDKEEENTIIIEYVNVDATENTEALVMSASDSQTINSVDIPVINFNQDKNGVELKYNGKPSQNVIDSMKVAGFRWSKFNKVWWSKQTEKALAYVSSLQAPESVEYEQVGTEGCDNVNTVTETPIFSYGLNWHVPIEYPSKLIECLQESGEVVADSERSFLFMHVDEIYLINDNGGEFNVLVNDEHFANIPYTSYSIPLNPETVVYRIMQVVHGLPIDYDYKIKSDNVVNLNDYKEAKGEPMQEEQKMVTEHGNSDDFSFDDILGKFDDIEITNDTRISTDDQSFCEREQMKYNEALQTMQQAIETFKSIYDSYEKDKWGSKKGYIAKYQDIGHIEDRIKEIKNDFISNVCSYFSKKYSITISNNFKTKYDTNVTYDNILDEIFIQLDGFSFTEKAVKEIKDSCKDKIRHEKMSIKKSKLVISDYIYWWNSYSNNIELSNTERTEALLLALSHFENGNTSILEVFDNMLSDYRKGIKHKDIFTKYEFELNKVKTFRAFKNGKVEIEFSSYNAALQFANNYCGYSPENKAM